MPPTLRSARSKHAALPSIVPTSLSKTIPTTSGKTQYWLMKAEPESRVVKGKDVKFSIDDLCAMKDSMSPWDGVRNFEARNIMRDQMKVGDKVLFYHSNCKVPGVAGTAIIVREGYADFTAFDTEHPYYDAKSTDPNSPKWYMVDVKFESKFDNVLSLTRMKGMDQLKEMTLIKRGRLSVQPVRQEEYEFIVGIAKQ